MKSIILSAAALALTAGASFADTVRMGTEGAYPPYNFIDDNGEVAGFEREVGDELCARAELTCEWVTNEWDTIIPNLLSGNYDTIIAGMSITDERLEAIDFTSDYYPPTASAYAALSADMGVDGVIAAQTSTIQAGHIASTGATLVEFATLDDTIAAVKNGEVDAVFADKDALAPFVAEQGFSFIGENVLLGGGIGMGVRKSDPELTGRFNAAIASMKADGSLNALLVKYFGEDIAAY